MVSTPAPRATTAAHEDAEAELARRQRLIARVGLLGALLMLMVLQASAYLRLTDAGIGCTPWPECFPRPRGAFDPLASQTGRDVARLAHRALAMVVALLVVLAGVAAVGRTPRLRAGGALFTALAVVVTGLALLGPASAGRPAVAVVIANVVGGMAAAALFFLLALRYGRERESEPRTSVPRSGVRAPALLALAVVAAEAALGAAASGGLTAAACADPVQCAGRLAPAFGAVMEGLAWRPEHGSNPFAVDVVLAHRWLGALCAALAGWAAVRARARAGRWTAPSALVALLAAAQLAAGAALPATRLALGLALAHNLMTCLLVLVLLAILAAPSRTP